MNWFLFDLSLIMLFYIRTDIVLKNLLWISQYIGWYGYQLFLYYIQLSFYPFIILNQFIIILYLIFVIKKIRNENK